MTDPITDLLNRLKNASAVKKTEILVPFSKLKNEIINILIREGFLKEAKKVSKGGKDFLKVYLNYDNNEAKPLISGFKRISRPGQRIYKPSKEIKKVKGGYGIAIISTSRGLKTDKEARKEKVGGEIICEIW